MKNVIYLTCLFVLVFAACRKKDSITYPTFEVAVQLTDTSGNNFTVAGVNVKLTATGSSNVFESLTDASGLAKFVVPAGVYQASASYTQADGVQRTIFNGNADANITVSSDWDKNNITKITLIEAQLSQVIIKEIFVGGTLKDDGSGTFEFDKYIVLYNNSTTPATLENVCLGMIAPYNSQASNGFYDESGKLSYESEGWIPAPQGYWYFQQSVTIQPGKQIVIALNNAVNNTITYSKSINFDNPEYYCTYDILQYNNANYYVAPAASIPTNHYLKAVKYGTGNAWSISVTSPGVFLFTTKGTTPTAFGADAAHNYNAWLSAYNGKKVPFDWVLDGVEVYLLNNENNVKRFTSNIDAGYVYHVNRQGYSIYRNVDKEATEAIAENAGKLVYNYALGTEGVGGTTDPSGIDAEASIKNGAIIIYMDTNNSTKDFHLRSKPSLRTN